MKWQKLHVTIVATVIAALAIAAGVQIPVLADAVYWTEQGNSLGDPYQIKRAGLDGTGVQTLISGLGHPFGLALDKGGGKLYWANNGASVACANLDGSGASNLVTGLGCPVGIALDLGTHKMYWTDQFTQKVQRANMNGTAVVDLVTPTTFWLSNVYGIDLDLVHGKMYFTDSATKILRSNLDGSQVETLNTNGCASGIALDVAAGKMYWTDAVYRKVHRSNLDGSQSETLVTFTYGSPAPLGIALDPAGGKMYFTRPGAHAIYRADLDGSNLETWMSGLARPLFVALDVQPIPEPSTLALLGIGAIGLLAYAWRRRRSAVSDGVLRTSCSSFHFTRRCAMKRLLILGACIVLCSSLVAQAGSVLVSALDYGGYGYGDYRWGNFTNALNVATGNQVTVASDFSNLGQMLGYDALLLPLRDYGSTLSSTELGNLSAFISTGRRVILMGENVNWISWDNQILGLVGGTFAGAGYGATNAVLSHSLTSGAATIYLPNCGLANGGTALYDKNVATLWGQNENVLTMLNVNVWSDPYWSSNDNGQFATNAAVWLAAPVPEPSTLVLLGMGAIGLLGWAWRRRRRCRLHKLSPMILATAMVLSTGVAQATDVFNLGGTRDPITGVWTGRASLETVPVGNVGNTADTVAHSNNLAGQGAVGYAYNIGKYKVTAGQYTEFP